MSPGIEPASDVDEETIVEEFVDETGAWRVGVFRAMGFNVGFAMVLAQDRRVDTHAVQAALENGCTHEQAIRIFA